VPNTNAVHITHRDGTQEVRPATQSGALAKLPTEKQLHYLRHLRSQLGEATDDMPRTRQGAFLVIERARRKLATALPDSRESGPTDAQLHDLAVLSTRLHLATPSPTTRGEAAGQLHRLRRLSES
jgi:hypothetical protein